MHDAPTHRAHHVHCAHTPQVRQLQLHDRAMLAGSKLIMGSRVARTFIAIYAALLHGFIMVLLYYAMSPRTTIEVVDMGALEQQQAAAAAVVAAAGSSTAGAAAGAAVKAGGRLLRLL